MKVVKWITIIILLGVAINGYIAEREAKIQKQKIICTFPETTKRMQTVDGYRRCLSNQGITPSETDIRKMCSLIAHDQFESVIHTGTEQDNYLKCIHAEGLRE